MQYFLLICLVSSVASQFEDIFGTPPSDIINDVTTTTASPPTVTDAPAQQCKCVPYYQCNSNLDGVIITNSSITGFGVLDVRFNIDGCQESVERCCKFPTEEADLPVHKPNPPRGCGYRNPKGLDFTATAEGGKGKIAQFGEFPWVVAILDASNSSYHGVGVLIHPQVVMTGANIARRGDVLKIRAGEWDTKTFKERLKYQEQKVQEKYIHQEFIKATLKNSIALLRLEQPVQLDDHINVICLPNMNENFNNYKGCIANGWGKDLFGKQGEYSTVLKQVEIDMVDPGRCQTLLRRTRLGDFFTLHSSFVCAGGEEGKDTCEGDGGAPLACPIGNDRYKLSGLVAWGIGCGQQDVPAVYTAVARFRAWVDDKMAAWGLDTAGYNI